MGLLPALDAGRLAAADGAPALLPVAKALPGTAAAAALAASPEMKVRRLLLASSGCESL